MRWTVLLAVASLGVHSACLTRQSPADRESAPPPTGATQRILVRVSHLHASGDQGRFSERDLSRLLEQAESGIRTEFRDLGVEAVVVPSRSENREAAANRCLLGSPGAGLPAPPSLLEVTMEAWEHVIRGSLSESQDGPRARPTERYWSARVRFTIYQMTDCKELSHSIWENSHSATFPGLIKSLSKALVQHLRTEALI